MSKAVDPKTIRIFSKSSALGLLGSEGFATDLPVEDLRKNLENFTNTLKTLLPAVADAGNGFSLTTVEVAIAIDGKGHVGFLGTGLDVGAQATITLTFGSKS
jgi:hypothetical protein